MYFIIEIQSTRTGEPAAIAPIPGYTDKDKAISAYYYKLVFASDPELSKRDIHTVMLIDHLGEVIMKNVFAHEIPEPIPEPIEEEAEEPIEEPAEEPIEEEHSEEPVEEPIEEEPIDEPIEEEEADAE